MTSPEAVPARQIRILAWSVLWLTVGVVVGGALVRATDSGAGCGESWPICGGRLIPHIGTYHTALEMSHRMSTVLLAILLVSLLVLVHRQHGKGHHLRRAVHAGGTLLIIESLLGASLVLFGWVEYDSSVARMIVVPLHIINTFLLVGAMTLTAYFASGGRTFRVDMSRLLDKILGGSLGVIMLIGATGALNALADTLILSGNLRESAPGELLVVEPVLRQIRTIHPSVSILGGLILFLLVRYVTADVDRRVRSIGFGVQGLIWVEVILGLLNVALEVPLEVQLTHLLVADLLWVLTMLIACNMLGERSSQSAVAATPAGGA